MLPNQRLMILTVMKMKEGKGLVHFGMVCSSWVTISRSSTGRSYFVPLGDRSIDSVNKANILVSRTVVLKHALLFQPVSEPGLPRNPG